MQKIHCVCGIWIHIFEPLLDFLVTVFVGNVLLQKIFLQRNKSWLGWDNMIIINKSNISYRFN